MAIQRFSTRFSAPALALTGLLVLCGAMWGDAGWAEQRNSGLVVIAVAIVLGAFAIATARTPEPSPAKSHWTRYALVALLLAHSAIAFHLVRTASEGMDCFTFQRDATSTLLHGQDPYGTTQPNIYDAEETARFYGPGVIQNGRVQVGLQYPPLTFLAAIPGYLLGDVRFGYVAAMLLAALFIYALLPDTRGLALSAFILLEPVAFIVEDRCWTEPLVFMLLCATLYTAQKRPRWLPLALGLFLASKQYNFVALPFLAYLLPSFSWKAWGKLLVQTLAVAIATMLPFALWNFRALFHDIVLFHLAQPLRQDAVSFAVPFPPYQAIGLLLLIAFMIWGARRAAQGAGQSPAAFAAAYGMALLLFVSASKQAFVNYYFLIAQAFVLAAAAFWPAETILEPAITSSPRKVLQAV